LVLEREGGRIEGTDRGESPLVWLKERKFGVMLCDIPMPNMDGLGFLANCNDKV
jgi:DNA-binding NtrC family response regulator